MHVTDGILPLPLCAVGYAVSLGACALGSRRLETEEVPRMGLLAAAAFVASTIHFPIAGTSAHFGLFGLLGMMLGLRALPVIFAVLLMQTFLFQHGGFLSLGVNAVNMGAGALCGWWIGRLTALPLPLRAFLAGLAGILVPAFLLLGEFLLVGYGRSLSLVAIIYLAVGLLEGVFTSMVTVFLYRVQPAMLAAARVPAHTAVAIPAEPAMQRNQKIERPAAG